MKFELSPSGVQIPDNDLLADLNRVAAHLGKSTVTKRDYVQHGSFAQQTTARRFGSWAEALVRAGLCADRPAPVSTEHCIADLQRVAGELGKTSVTLAEYRARGTYSERPFIRNFGTWEKALKIAGLSSSPQFHQRVPDEDYFENIERIWIFLGRQPKYSEIAKPLSGFSARAYENRFGSWRKALEAFVRFVAEDQSRSVDARPLAPSRIVPEPATPANGTQFTQEQRKSRRTPRKPSLRLRFLVMRQDNFRCCLCGRSPALEPGLVLEVDHMVAWDKGGETILENLQTLCQRCNLGKSNIGEG